MKISAAVCLAIRLIISSTFMMCYWNLFSRANSYNKMVKDLNNPNLAHLNYDRCVSLSDTSSLGVDSKWRMIFHFNAWVNTITSGITLFGFLGLFKFSLFRPTANCLNCAGLVHMAAIWLAGYGVFGPSGVFC